MSLLSSHPCIEAMFIDKPAIVMIAHVVFCPVIKDSSLLTERAGHVNKGRSYFFVAEFNSIFHNSMSP